MGHVQVSQTPDRNCPMNADGEVNHRYFLSKLIAPFYQDFIGLEYFGKTNMKGILSRERSVDFYLQMQVMDHSNGSMNSNSKYRLSKELTRPFLTRYF